MDGIPVLTVESLDCAKNNAHIQKLKRKLAGLRKGDPQYTDGLYGEEIEEEIKSCEKQLKRKYQNLFDAMKRRFDSLTDARYMDPELQITMDLIVKGDYERTLQILKSDEVKQEADVLIQEQRINRRKAYEITLKKYENIITAATQTNDLAELNKTYPLAVELIACICMRLTQTALIYGMIMLHT